MNAIVSRMFQAQYVDSVVTVVEMYGVVLNSNFRFSKVILEQLSHAFGFL